MAAMATATTAITTHILVFPFPAQGHMIPLLDLTHHLIITDRSITATILVTPKNLHLLDQLLSVHPDSVRTLVLPFPPHPSVPAGVENAKDMPPDIRSFLSLIPALGGLRDPLLRWFRSHPCPPVAVVSDMFLGWTHKLAEELGIPRVTFSPSGAMALSAINSLWARLPTKTDFVSYLDMPNCPKYPWSQIFTTYRTYAEDPGSPESEFIKEAFLGNRASWGMAVNTFSEMERLYLDHLKGATRPGRVWAVGPVAPMAGPGQRGGPSSVSAESLLSWLAACEEGEVVYVCFGSQAVLRIDQMEALAAGLEQSGARFIWTLKDASDVRGPPAGVLGRGLVIRGWAPQVVILGHPAVGTFLTHCGWNSTLEAVVAGVQILAWPMRGDQYLNATLLVDYLRVAIKVCEGEWTVPDPAGLASVLAESVGGAGRAKRERARELSGEALRAVGEGGSSARDLKSLIVHLGAIGRVATSNID